MLDLLLWIGGFALVYWVFGKSPKKGAKTGFIIFIIILILVVLGVLSGALQQAVSGLGL